MLNEVQEHGNRSIIELHIILLGRMMAQCVAETFCEGGEAALMLLTHCFSNVDVLATYGSQIAECMCSVSRSESAGINWVPDDKFPLDTLHTITKGESSVFTSPFIKDSSAPWVFTVINDNGAVHSTPTKKGGEEK